MTGKGRGPRRNALPGTPLEFCCASARWAGVAVALLGLLVLGGWILDLPFLKSAFPGLATTKANAALCFVLAGLSLRLAASGQARRLGQGAAAAAALLGLLTLCQYLFAWDLGLDQLLFRDTSLPFPGRMAPATALDFLLTGLALLLLDRRPWVSQLLALAVLAVSFPALAGYLYGVSALYQVGPYVSMALPTALGFLLLGAGALAARPERGFAAVLAGDTLGGKMARRLLPAVVGVPLALGWIRLEGQRAGLYDTEFGLALFAVANVGVLAALLWWNARLLHRAELERRQAEDQLIVLSRAVAHSPISILITDTAGDIRYVNPRFTEVTGYTPAEVRGKNPRLLKSGQTPPEVFADLWQTITAGRDWRGELCNKKKTGEPYWDLVWISPIRDAEGRITHYLGIQEDITQRRRMEEAARQNAEHIRAIAAALPDLLFVLDEEGRYVEVLTSQEHLLYEESQKLKGRLMHEVLPREAADLFLEVVRETIATGQPQVIEYTLQVQEGRRHFEGRTAPLPVAPGEKRAVVWVSRDLTQRKEAEEQLLLFRSLIDHTDDSIEVIDPETGRFLDVSEKACLAHGYTREEYLALTVPEIDPRVAGRRWEETRDEVRRLGSRVFESQHRRKDGSLFPVEVSIAYIRLDRDYLLAVVRDITARKRQEAQQQAVQKVREQLWQMKEPDDIWQVLTSIKEGLEHRRVPFDTCGIGLVDTSVDPQVVLFHDLGQEKRWAHSDSTQATEIVLRIWREGKTAYRRNLEAEDPYGEWEMILHRPYNSSVRCVVDVPFSHGTLAINSRQPHAFSDQDLEFLQELAGVLSEGFRRLDDLKTLAAIEEQLRQTQRLEAIGQLAGGVAHDFNNLLTVVSGYGEHLLRRLAPDHPDHGNLREILGAAERGANLVRQLLAFSRRQVLEPRVLDLNALVKGLERMLGRLIGEDVELVLTLAPDLGQVRADPGQLEQVLVNLAVNARDAMPQGGKLLVQTRNADLDRTYAAQHPPLVPGAYALLSVSDTGTGMDKTTQARIFEPFFTTKAPGQGTGLGLAMVYGIVKQSGGYIWVYSEPGQGTTFKIYLPRLSAEVRAAAPEEAAPVARGSETVLLAEDEAPLRQLAALLLREEGYTVLEAGRGQEALEAAGRHQGEIHLLVTDMVMPGMSGPELVAQLHRLRPDLKVLYMSGYSEDIIAHRVELQPGTTFLQKPFRSAALLLKVRQVLDG